jgi:hypothetical protein
MGKIQPDENPAYLFLCDGKLTREAEENGILFARSRYHNVMITDMQGFFWRSFGFPLMALQIMLTGGMPTLVAGMLLIFR